MPKRILKRGHPESEKGCESTFLLNKKGDPSFCLWIGTHTGDLSSARAWPWVTGKKEGT